MQKNKTRVLSLIVGLLILSQLFACANTVESGDTTAVSNESTTEVSGEETEGYLSDHLPAKDFGGADLNILTTPWYDAPSFIFSESQNGEIMNDEIFKSISSVSERFNLNVTLTANDDYTVLSTTVHNLVLAGDDTYQITYNHDLKTVSNALNGDFMNILDLPNVDFSNPWWNGTSDSFKINDKLYFTGNCLSMSGIFMNCVLAVNKTLADNYGVDIPYEKVKAGEWYIDDLTVMTKDVLTDLDGNNVYNENDMYGIVTSYYGFMGIQSNLEGSVLSKDRDGYLTFNENAEHIVGIMEKVEALFKNGKDDYGGNTEYGYQIFIENRALFMYGEARVLYNNVRDSDVVYGILPFPKYDANQKDYRSAGFDIYWAVIKTAAGQSDMIGTAVEALSCSNYNNVVPKVWETVLGRKLADSQDDTDMFNIIRDIQYVDLTFAFSGQSSALDDLSFLIKRTTSDKAASYMESKKNTVLAAIEKINTYYSQND